MIKQNSIFIILLTFHLIAMGQSNINQYDDNGERHGIWKKYFDDSKQLRYEGQFNHGKEVGLFKYYQLIGKVSKLAATKQFNESDNSALVKFISLSGKTVSEGIMVGTSYVGKWIYYHKNSENIMTIEHYNDDGLLHGKKSIFYDNNQLAEEVNYVSGKRQGVENHYSLKGKLMKLYHYEDDELHGETKHYDDFGQVSIEGQYQRDKKTGLWKYYSNGKLIDQKDFNYRPKFKKKQ